VSHGVEVTRLAFVTVSLSALVAAEAAFAAIANPSFEDDAETFFFSLTRFPIDFAERSGVLVWGY